jgi:predicted CopG family antitoxin
LRLADEKTTMYLTYTLQAMNKRVSVSVDAAVYKQLRARGRFGESFSNIISRLLDETKIATEASEST